MSQFEFIFVFISIIAGLALTQLLSGMARPPRNSTGRIDTVHVAFSTATLIILMSVWWSTFRWQEYENWTVVEFLLLCGYVSIFYVLAVMLSPSRTADMLEFKRIRVKFYAVLAFYCVLEPVVINIRDGELEPWYYLPMMVHYLLLSMLGIALRKDLFDRLFSLWMVVANLAWVILARFAG